MSQFLYRKIRLHTVHIKSLFTILFDETLILVLHRKKISLKGFLCNNYYLTYGPVKTTARSRTIHQTHQEYPSSNQSKFIQPNLPCIRTSVRLRKILTLVESLHNIIYWLCSTQNKETNRQNKTLIAK